MGSGHPAATPLCGLASRWRHREHNRYPAALSSSSAPSRSDDELISTVFAKAALVTYERSSVRPWFRGFEGRILLYCINSESSIQSQQDVSEVNMAIKKRNVSQIIIELEGFAPSSAQRNAISKGVSAVLVRVLEVGKNDGLLVRPTTLNRKTKLMKIAVARVLDYGNM